MATFTIRVKDLIDEDFDFGMTAEDYPIYNEMLRGVLDDNRRWQYNIVASGEGQVFYGLNRKILDHYYFREIGQESEDMFRYMLNHKLRLVMPFYNQMLHSETLTFDPFETMDTEHESNSTSDNDATAKSRSVSGNAPQVALAGNADYASAFTDSNSQSSGTNTAENTVHLKGSQGHKAALLMNWRRSFLNIEASIVNELDSLFMQITDVQDSMYERNNRVGYAGRPLWPYF